MFFYRQIFKKITKKRILILCQLIYFLYHFLFAAKVRADGVGDVTPANVDGSGFDDSSQ